MERLLDGNAWWKLANKQLAPEEEMRVERYLLWVVRNLDAGDERRYPMIGLNLKAALSIYEPLK